MTYEYKVVEEKENPLDSVIEKSNLSVKFTLSDLQNDFERANKIIAEARAQKEVDGAAKLNISTNHPHVLEATDEEVQKAHALTLYRQYINKVKEAEQKIVDVENYFKGYYEELEVIKKQTKLEIPNDKS